MAKLINEEEMANGEITSPGVKRRIWRLVENEEKRQRQCGVAGHSCGEKKAASKAISINESGSASNHILSAWRIESGLSKIGNVLTAYNHVLAKSGLACRKWHQNGENQQPLAIGVGGVAKY
jgi:hypothetical protein